MHKLFVALVAIMLSLGLSAAPGEKKPDHQDRISYAGSWFWQQFADLPDNDGSDGGNTDQGPTGDTTDPDSDTDGTDGNGSEGGNTPGNGLPDLNNPGKRRPPVVRSFLEKLFGAFDFFSCWPGH